MQVEILASPSFSFASITIAPAAAVHVEAGAMAAYSDGVEVETKARVCSYSSARAPATC
jgi:uncharacterized protein (AIM24 family)